MIETLGDAMAGHSAEILFYGGGARSAIVAAYFAYFPSPPGTRWACARSTSTSSRIGAGREPHLVQAVARGLLALGLFLRPSRRTAPPGPPRERGADRAGGNVARTSPEHLGARSWEISESWSIPTGGRSGTGSSGSSSSRTSCPRRCPDRLWSPGARRRATSSARQPRHSPGPETLERQPRVGGAMQATDGMADRFEHPLDLVLLSLVDRELETRGPRRRTLAGAVLPSSSSTPRRGAPAPTVGPPPPSTS